MDDETPPAGSNCTDETKRDAYRQALILKIAVESKRAELNKKQGEYRAYLKAASKRGVSTSAITNALAVRMEDPDLVLIEERERIKMLALSGFLPGIRDQLFSRLDIEEPTTNENHQMEMTRARDLGVTAGREGHPYDNPYVAGTEVFVVFHQAYVEGQEIIADEMAPAKPKPRGRPKKEAPADVAAMAAEIADEMNTKSLFETEAQLAARVYGETAGGEKA